MEFPSLADKVVLCTGGAGSIGSALVKKLLESQVRVIRVFDSDEYGLFVMNKELQDSRLRLLLGDVRDRDRVHMAMQGVDAVFHFAAAKNIDVTEYNVPETVRVNALGTINLVESALLNRIEKFLFISSDKSLDVKSLYGATKFIGEKTTLWGAKVSDHTLFSCTRFGNVIESRGNVFDVWKREKERDRPLTVTDPTSTRYYWHVGEAVDFILKVYSQMKGGEIFVPMMKAVAVIDLARGISDNIRVIGLRHNEMLHQELLTKQEEMMAERGDGMWIVRET